MMAENDEASRKARARALHQQIDALVKGKKERIDEPEEPVEPPTKGKESLRGFIERRMRELEEQGTEQEDDAPNDDR